MQLHGARLSRLEEQAPKVRVFGLLLKLFRNEKWPPFRTSCLCNFDTELKSDRPEDRTAAVYRIIADMMSPFAFPMPHRNGLPDRIPQHPARRGERITRLAN